MTNEELVQMIRDGQPEYIPQLWEQVYRFICLMAKKRLAGEEDHVKQLEDDLINESYFDFLKAVEGYKFDREGSFLTYLTYHVKNSFNRALGVRTQKDRRNPMRYAASLDAPVEGAEDITLQDMIVDNLSEEGYRFIENEAFWQDVHELLEAAIFAVTNGTAQDILLTVLRKNCTPAEAMTILKIPEDRIQSVRTMYYTGLNRIRAYLRSKARRKCQEIGIDHYIGCRSVGLSAWKQHGFTSATEMEAIWLVDRDQWDRLFAKRPRKYRKF